MKTAAVVLLAVAKELAKQAVDSMPELQEDEVLLREWYEDGIYYRETRYNGISTTYSYDFRHKKIRLLAAGEIR